MKRSISMLCTFTIIFTLIFTISLTASAMSGFDVIDSLNVSYLSGTNKFDLSQLTLFTTYDSIDDGDLTIYFSPGGMDKRIVLQGWSSYWGTPPAVEEELPHLLFSRNVTTTWTFSEPISVLGFEVQGDAYGTNSITVDFYSGSDLVGSITKDVITTSPGDTSGGAGLIAAQSSIPFDKIVFSTYYDLAVAQIRYSVSPLNTVTPKPTPRGNHELVTLLTNPTDGTGVRTMDLNYYLNDPVIWGTDVKNITVWLESEIFDLAKTQQKAKLPAGLSLLKDYNIRLMMKIVYNDGTVETKEVNNSHIARNIPVLIPVDEFAGISDLGIVYMDTEGHTAVLPVTPVTIDGYKFLQFDNNHFSEYGVVSGIAPTPAPAAPKQQTYTILPGDTLASIAAKFGVTVQSLAAANKISNPDLIFAGKDLIIA